MQAWAQVWAKERWVSFLVWVESGVSGIHPLTLALTLGPIARLLPQAQQVACSVNSWLLALLAERQRRGLATGAGDTWQETAEILEADSCQQPYEQSEIERQERWLRWLLLAELLRLVRLAEAPEAMLSRREWLAWEVRYWALAVSLARLGQVYSALVRQQGREAATQVLEEALGLAWSQATAPAQAA